MTKIAKGKCLHKKTVIINLDGKNKQGKWFGGEVSYCKDCLAIIKGMETAKNLGLEKDGKYIK